MIENLELTRQVATMAADACEELFIAYGVELMPGSELEVLPASPMLCGVIGFVGSGIRGSCMLVGHDAPILASCPEGGSRRDWIGELTNQLAGRVKAKFLSLGIEVALSTPIGLSGVALRPLPRHDIRPTCFEAHDGQVIVWVEVESDRAFVFGRNEPVETARRLEGEIVLF